MATYTDVSAFKADFWPDRSAADSRFIQRGAAAAYNYINGKLSRFYAVPFSSTYPPLIVDVSDFITKSIAEFLVKKGRMPKVKEIAKDSPFDPITILDELCKNKIELLDSAGALIARKSATGSWTNIDGKLRIFDRDHEFNHELHTTDADNIADDRSEH